ncbi:MAG TPA: tRNA (adenosine(37)-N6)-dimethylallyltransferase MiaA [Elusimicrobiota bacterium]|nr:tRNA (adenosine(37)-N6)-dimethylallyltransferase MiaA [Elusimicrobiota bacterium]
MEKISPAPKIICVVGPTASGKTDLALALARELNGEIISADSRQVYRCLDAGTAKPARDSSGRARGVPYHLIDEADPAEPFDAGRFAKKAQSTAEDILKRGNLPLLVGGTGLYVKAFLKGLSPMPRKNEAVRGRLEALGREKGRTFLHAQLAAQDPAAAAKIPPNNIQRLVRALEVLEVSGRPISEMWGKTEEVRPRWNALVLGVEWPAEQLRRRIEARCRAMWPEILREIRALVPARYSGTEPGFQSLGYSEALAAWRGEISQDDGLALFMRRTAAYAKRQRTWFRHQENCAPVSGGDLGEMTRQALAAAKVFLEHVANGDRT